MRSTTVYILIAVLVALVVFLFYWGHRSNELNETSPEVPKAINSNSIPYMGIYKCSTPNCSEFLTAEDQNNYMACGNMPSNVKCHFMDGANRSPVALASYPGSGNTWVRGLLEKATGICTGSIYCDTILKESGMNGENLRGGSVLVTKTHSMRPMKWGSILTTENKYGIEDTPYSAAILIVRNPFDALVSLYGWKTFHSHTKQLGEVVMKNPWVEENAVWWKSMFIAWFEGNTENKPLLVIKYENLKSNLLPEVERMLQFLHVPYSEEELIRILEEDYGKFHRSHHDDFDHFSAASREFVHGVIEESVVLLQEKNNGNTFGLEEYLS